MHPSLKSFEQFIQQRFSGVLSISPDNSLTPFPVEMEGQIELWFIAKATPFFYAPLKKSGLDEKKKTELKFQMYNEGTDLIVRFEAEGVFFESEFRGEDIRSFLSALIHQEMMTFVVVDATTYELIWVTNTINFRAMRFQYADFFRQYGIIE